MDIFINSISAISPVDSFNQENLLLQTPEMVDGWYKCIEPDYREIIDPRKLRRMSKAVKMGVTTGLKALNDADIANPDAIIMGTGIGCILDTEKFLQQLIDNDESLLNPTAFIQSTHNTVAGQIALLIGCNSYNFTFTQKTHSFESALLESKMLMNDGEANTVLVGGIDETTNNTVALMQRAACAQSDKDAGYVPGEGSSFFSLSNEKGTNNIAKLIDVSVKYGIDTTKDLERALQEFLVKNGLEFNDIDLLLSGNNNSESKWYNAVNDCLSLEKLVISYKDYCGEYDTASSFAMWLGTKLIHEQDAQKVLIYNTDEGYSHSFILLTKC